MCNIDKSATFDIFKSDYWQGIVDEVMPNGHSHEEEESETSQPHEGVEESDSSEDEVCCNPLFIYFSLQLVLVSELCQCFFPCLMFMIT